MLVTSRLRMTVLVHLIGQYILTTIKSTKKHQSVCATMNALSVQLSLHASTIVLKNDTRRHLRIITKTNTKKKAKNSNEKYYTHTKLTRARTKSIGLLVESSTRFKTNKKNDHPRTGAGPDNARYLNSSPWANP